MRNEKSRTQNDDEVIYPSNEDELQDNAGMAILTSARCHEVSMFWQCMQYTLFLQEQFYTIIESRKRQKEQTKNNSSLRINGTL